MIRTVRVPRTNRFELVRDFQNFSDPGRVLNFSSSGSPNRTDRLWSVDPWSLGSIKFGSVLGFATQVLIPCFCNLTKESWCVLVGRLESVIQWPRVRSFKSDSSYNDITTSQSERLKSSNMKPRNVSIEILRLPILEYRRDFSLI